MKFCENCDGYAEIQNGRCVVCNEILETKSYKVKFDEWEDSDKEWGTEDEAEEIREVRENAG